MVRAVGAQGRGELGAAERIEGVPLGVGALEADLVVLPVHGHERGPDLGEQAHGHGTAAGRGTGACAVPRRRDAAAEDQVVGAVVALVHDRAGLLSQAERRVVRGHAHAGVHDGTGRAPADRARVGASTEQQAQGGDHHGLAGAGLTGDDGEAGVQVHGGLADHAEPRDPQMVDHASSPG